ncbi:lipid A deacylase LpxR family protein [Vibrio sp. VB16]|uniref:lipid A deacylase LpxR family protein n=1 Tax=Vibrio sp. VB16 TaxID=2785746 RepID=UPI0018A09CC9|nr:lipid A deacylase LpxR family protein [Vibrio sp. VB16]UGA55954.1 lipid A deacylase LpxR family protein [Vibrio sp. VB16]
MFKADIIQLKHLFISSIFLLPFTANANDSMIAISFDNDGPFGTDQNYTNGIQIDYSTSLLDLDHALVAYSPLSLLEKHELNTHKWHVNIGQKMWTPSDIKKEQPEPNERAYAGLLYTQGELITISDKYTQAFGLMIGVTGPKSFAEGAQRIVHEIVGSDTPQGWDYQIEGTFIANLSYDSNYQLYAIDMSAGLSHEISAPIRILAGNYRSEIATGLLWRWGLNLQDSTGSTKTENEMSFKSYMVQGKTTGAFLFAGAEARYRFNDITIDGDRPDEVYPTDVEHLQATAVFGGAVYGESIGGSATLAFKSEDFEQDLNGYSANLSMSLFWMF